MDPVSAISLAASCASLTRQIFTVTSALSTLHEKFNTAQVAISSLVSQLSALEASTTELESILIKRQSSLSQGDKLLMVLEESLNACDDVIKHLFNQVSDVESALETRLELGRWARAKYGFNDDGLALMKEALRDQLQAIQLLLSIAGLTRQDERQTVLHDADSVAVLKKATDGSSSLLWPRDAHSRASFIRLQTETLSRLSMIFTFGGEMLHSKPYRAVVLAAWKKLRLRQNDGPGDAPAVTHQDSHMPDIWQMRGLKSTVVMIVKWDFQAMRRDELECMKGQVLLPVAMPNGAYGDDWVVAKPIGSLGGNGLVPITYVSVISRSGKIYDPKNAVLRELREVGIPNVEEWKESSRRYVEGAISLGLHSARLRYGEAPKCCQP